MPKEPAFAPQIQEVFNDVASVYDVMNDFMSFGLHHTWKDIFVQKIPLKTPSHGQPLACLDMASGTGDIALRLHERIIRESIAANITVCDKNKNMLDKGRAKYGHMPWTWVTADATCLSFEDNSFDLYAVSFGLRNMPPLYETLKEACRVLRHSGYFYVLEFSQPESPFLKGLYNLYAKTWLPFLGTALARKSSAYSYLVNSIEQFPKAPILESMIKDAGFVNTNFEALMGGIVTIHWGQKG
jgi:ubiquinone/menaquinone biosynthesis methyltransferase